MKVVIPYRKAPNHDLFFAVKSIEKFYSELEDIVIVGDKPTFPFNGLHIPAKDSGDKEYSIYNKVKMVPGEILFTNDDIYFLKPMSDIPNYYKGLCSEVKHKDQYYARMYRNCPIGWKDFDVHCPMVINTDKLAWLGQMPLKSQYGNSTNIEGVLIKDFKIRKIEQLDLTREFVSTTDHLSRSMYNILEDIICI